MKQINNNTRQNCSVVEQVTASKQENRAGTESLADIVEQIMENHAKHAGEVEL